MNDIVAVEVDLPASISSADSLLEPVVACLGKGGFFGDSSHGHAVYLPGKPDRYASLFDRHAFSCLAGKAKALQAAFVDAEGWPVDIAIVREQIPRMLSAGMTISASGLPDTGRMGRFLEACRAAAPNAAEFSCNASLSSHGVGFAMHLDPRPVLIMQIAGCKHWRYVVEPEPLSVMVGIALPPGCDMVDLPWGCVHRPGRERIKEIMLSPGDALYLPAGCWHEGRSQGESLALSVTTVSLPLLEAFKKAIAEGVAFRNAGMRGSYTAGHTGLESFRMVAAGLSVQDMYAAWNALAARADD